MATHTIERDETLVEDALIELNHTLNHLTFPGYPEKAQDCEMLRRAVHGATQHLRFGRLERAASMVDEIRRQYENLTA